MKKLVLNNVNVWYDEINVMAQVHYTSTTNYSQSYDWKSFNAIENLSQYPELVPKSSIYTDIASVKMRIRLNNDGGVFQYQAIEAVTASSSNPFYIHFVISWLRA